MSILFIQGYKVTTCFGPYFWPSGHKNWIDDPKWWAETCCHLV